jgi:riboflavin biosynthesis pyrimidine reductase
VQSLYGADVLAAAGILHVASAWDAADGERRIIRITDASPKSAFDAFALHLARARADVILTTGAILRAEPALRYDLGGDTETARGLEGYRRDILGKTRPPELLILTSGKGLDLTHPALCGPFPATLVVPPDAELMALPAHIARRELPEGGVRALLGDARRARPEQLFSVEAGPRTHRALYEDPLLVDELMLTLYLGDLDPTLRGGITPDGAELEALLGPPRSMATIDEPSGRFRFLRYARR